MRSLICLSLVAIFAVPAEAQLLRRFRYCPPIQQDIITIQPPAAPVSPEVPYMNIQAIPQPVPIPMPNGGGGSGVNLGDLALGLNLHWHNLMGSHPQPQAAVAGGDDSLLKLALIMKMLNGDNIKQQICDDNGDGDDTESIKMMMLMKMMADHRAEDADDSNDQNGDKETINALIQALMANKAPTPAPQPVQIQPVPQPSVVVPQNMGGISCGDLLKALLGNK